MLCTACLILPGTLKIALLFCWHLNQAVYIDEAAPWHIVSLFSIEINSFIESSLLLGLFSVAYWSAGEWTAFSSDVCGASSDNYTLVRCCVGKIVWESVVSEWHSSTCVSHLCICFLPFNLFIRYIQCNNYKKKLLHWNTFYYEKHFDSKMTINLIWIENASQVYTYNIKWIK